MSAMNQISSPNEIRVAVGRAVHNHWLSFLIEGLVLIALGLLAIIVPPIASLAVTIFLGWLFLIGGCIGLVMTAIGRHVPGFWWSIFSAVLALFAGGALLWSPVQGLISLTVVLIAFFALDGIASIMLAIEHRPHLPVRWSWLLASGVVDLVIAGIILLGLPSTAAWTLGLLVGIDLVFAGSSLAAISLAARKQV